jgi:quercetin dioxygenase-like cupin family protein
MQAHNLVDALEGLGEVEFKRLDDFNDGNVGVYWARSGISPWERHPEDEELLYVIEGHVAIEILTETESIEVSVPAGSSFVVPRNHWHRHKVEAIVKEMYVTPGRSETSSADDPRNEATPDQ